MSIKKQEEGLNRVIGVWGICLNVINNIIGGGIFLLLKNGFAKKPLVLRKYSLEQGSTVSKL